MRTKDQLPDRCTDNRVIYMQSPIHHGNPVSVRVCGQTLQAASNFTRFDYLLAIAESMRFGFGQICNGFSRVRVVYEHGSLLCVSPKSNVDDRDTNPQTERDQVFWIPNQQMKFQKQTQQSEVTKNAK